ncbi:hypothetical protein D1007_37795 [Hordeum vulgare]|nr:hypothetical protein D1007_37795 [Hordeum vulgare]
MAAREPYKTPCRASSPSRRPSRERPIDTPHPRPTPTGINRASPADLSSSTSSSSARPPSCLPFVSFAQAQCTVPYPPGERSRSDGDEEDRLRRAGRRGGLRLPGRGLRGAGRVAGRRGCWSGRRGGWPGHQRRLRRRAHRRSAPPLPRRLLPALRRAGARTFPRGATHTRRLIY